MIEFPQAGGFDIAPGALITPDYARPTKNAGQVDWELAYSQPVFELYGMVKPMASIS